MQISKERLNKIIKEELKLVQEGGYAGHYEANPAAQAIRDDIAAHQDVESTPARSGRDIATELGYDETEKTDPLAGMDPELVNAAAYRLRQQIDEFISNVAPDDILTRPQAKAIFLAAIAKL
jgi:hypothetical protein